MTKFCVICETPFSRRDNETPNNYKKRKTCGDRHCVVIYRTRRSCQKLPYDADDWWLPLPGAPTLPPAAFVDDASAARPEYGARLYPAGAVFPDWLFHGYLYGVVS